MGGAANPTERRGVVVQVVVASLAGSRDPDKVAHDPRNAGFRDLNPER